MVWPCLIILICGIIFIYMETQRRGMNFCGDGHSKRGLADGAEDNLHGSETMLRWQPGKDRAECQLVTGSNDAANVSSSMSSLERLQKVDDPLLSNGRPGASKSADNVKNNKVNNSSDTKALLPESDTNTLSRIAIVVDPPSTGNRDGLPVWSLNHTLWLYSLSGQKSYRKISWSLEVARLGFRLFQSLWILTGTPAVSLPRCLSNFRAILSS